MAVATEQGLSPERPFPGLRPFAFSDHDYFFGRKLQFYTLYRLVDINRLVAVIGSSGSGKSSLVSAGLLPLLQQENDEIGARKWLWQAMRPGDGPIAQLSDALVAVARTIAKDDDPVISAAREERIRQHLLDSSFGIEGALSEVEGLDQTSFVLVVDQFEELFRFVVNASQGIDPQFDGRTRNEATRFVQLLLAASRSRSHDVRVIITMRSDFIGDCARFQGLPEAVAAAQFLVPSLTRDQREQVIRGPIRATNATIDPVVVERILIDSSEEFDQLPVMAHCLRRLWDRAGDAPVDDAALGGGRRISQEHYKDIGGISDALSQHANRILRDLPGLTLAVEQTFRSLSELDKEGRATRRARLFEQLLAEAGVSENELRKVLDRFRTEDCSFLTPPLATVPILTAQTRIDVGHEALLRRWEEVSGEPGATGEANDRRRLGWLQDEAHDGKRYQALLSLAENEPTTTLPLDQVERHWNWWTARPRTKAWAARYGGGYERIQRLMNDSRAALDVDQKRRKLEAKRENRRYWVTRAAFIAALAGCAIVGMMVYHMNTQADKIDTQEAMIKGIAEEVERNRDIGLNQTRRLTFAVLQASNKGAVSVETAQDILTTAEDALEKFAGPVQTSKSKVERAQFLISASDIHAALGDKAEALGRAQRAKELATELVAAEATDDHHQILYESLLRLGDSAVRYSDDPKQVAAGLKSYQEAIPIALRLKNAKPGDAKRLYDLAWINNRIAEALLLQGNFADAIAHLNQALELADRCAAMPRAKEQWQVAPAIIHISLGVALAGQGAPDSQKIITEFDKAIELQNGPLFDVSGSARSVVARSYLTKANTLINLGRYEPAYESYTNAIIIFEKLVADNPGNLNWLMNLAAAYMQYGTVLLQQNDLNGAFAQFGKEVDVRNVLFNKNINNDDWKKDLANSRKRFSELASKLLGTDVPHKEERPTSQ